LKPLLASPLSPVWAGHGAGSFSWAATNSVQFLPVRSGLIDVLSPLIVNLPPPSALTVPTAYVPTSDRLSPNDTWALNLVAGVWSPPRGLLPPQADRTAAVNSASANEVLRIVSPKEFFY